MILHADQVAPSDLYRILIGSIAPRPIAWVGSRSRNGVNNLAPFSFYNCVSANPPVIGFSVIPRPDGRRKDTLQNVLDARCFTLSAASHFLVQQMSKSAATLEPDHDEFAYAGLEAAEAPHVAAPYVKAALLVYECTLRDVISFGDQQGAGNLVLGDIRHVLIDDNLYQNGRIDFEKLDPVGRLAGNWYSTIRDKFELQRG